MHQLPLYPVFFYHDCFVGRIYHRWNDDLSAVNEGLLGANVGTTITAQIIAFKVTKAALLLIALGFFTEVLAKNQRFKQFGVMFMGLGMLFFGMELMSQATAPLRSYEPFMQLMQDMANPLIGVLIGAVFTALVQSSSATTGIVIVMASRGFYRLKQVLHCYLAQTSAPVLRRLFQP